MCSNHHVIITAIKYDADIDIRIVNSIVLSGKNETITMSELRRNVPIYQKNLERHVECLVRWHIINDQKSPSNGKARKLTLNMDYGDAMRVLMKLKDAIETVNEFFA